MLVHISLTEGIGFDIKDYIQYIKMIEMTNAMLIMYEFLICSLNGLCIDEYYSYVCKFNMITFGFPYQMSSPHRSFHYFVCAQSHMSKRDPEGFN